MKDLRSRLEESYKLTCQNAQKSAKRNKNRFDQRVKPASLDVGDRVLVRNVRIRGKHKLEDKWEQEVYVVVKRAGDLPVYIVRPETREGPNHTLHRDLLLPCGFLSASVTEDFPEDLTAQKPHTLSQSHNRTDQVDIFEDEDTTDAELTILGSFAQFPMKFSVERVSGGEHDPTTCDIVGSALPTATSDTDSVLPSPQSPATRSSIAISLETHLPEVEESWPTIGEDSSVQL